MGSGEVRAFMEQLESELAAAHERIRRLEAAGDYWIPRDSDAQLAWTQAKEAKP
jgi:hypothetical protein